MRNLDTPQSILEVMKTRKISSADQGKKETHTEFWNGNVLENVHSGDRERNNKITLLPNLMTHYVRMEGGWNWLKTISSLYNCQVLVLGSFNLSILVPCI